MRAISLTSSKQHREMAWGGLDDLPVEDQIDYVQCLWDRIATTADQVPLSDWQRRVLEEQIAAHRASPGEAFPWRQVLDRLEQCLHQAK